VRISGLIVTCFLVGCFPPDLGEGKIICGANGACPGNYQCNPANNRCYTPGYPVSAIDMSGAVEDMAGQSGVHDLTMTGMSGDMKGVMPSDMAMSSGGCGPTVPRVCVGTGQSAKCDNSMGAWMPMVDRTCPSEAPCDKGYCQPPQSMVPCTSNSVCTANRPGTVCIEYVVMGGALKGFCTVGFNANGNVTHCTVPNDPNKCDTGLCASGSGGRTCLEVCTMTTNQCASGHACEAVDGTVMIEGVSASSLMFCAP
jgi:hypothetical protein